MELYLYDEITKEYKETIEAYLDPAETALRGEPVYMYPANSTGIKPPVAGDNEIVLFENDNWVIKPDYRGLYQCNEDFDVTPIGKLGELENGYIVITKEQADKIAEDKLYYVIIDGELVENPNYEEEKAQKEAERIAKLNLTGSDVERGIYKVKGMDFNDILAYVTQLQPEGLDVKALGIELKANHFYRGNSYVDAVGALLGFTKEQLDKFFEFNDYFYLISKPLVDNSEPDVDNSEPTETEEPMVEGDTDGEVVNNSEE